MFPLIIELIYWSLMSNDIRLLIIGLLREYLKSSNSSSLKQTLKQENINEDELEQPFSLFNPNVINKLLRIITPKEILTIKSAINKVKKLTNSSGSNNKVKLTDLEKIQNKANKEYKTNQELQDFYANNWTILSSSWFKKGIYKMTDNNTRTGELTALLQSDNSKKKIWYGPYTWPAFPSETWELMKQQKGKNGSGAGTIFWRYWNKTWLPSQLRNYVKGRLAKSKNITKGKKTENVLFPNINLMELLPDKNINVAKTMAYIHRLERNFPKLKKYSDLTKTDIGSAEWRKKRKDIFQFQQYKKNVISIVKNTNKWK